MMARARITIGFCILPLLISGCISAARTRNRSVKPTSKSVTAPLPLSDYIRTIYRISEEGALEPEEQRQKVLQSHPELSELAACVAADALNTECRVKLAEAYVREGLLWSAYTLFNEVLKLNGDDFRSTVGLGRIWDQWKDYSNARRFAESAVASDPKSSVAHELMANVLLHLNDPAAAITEFKKSLELSPDNPVVISNLGYAQMMLHNWPEAKGLFERALSLDSKMEETRNNLGIVLIQMGDYEAGLAQMKQVSGPAVAFNNLGVVLLIFKKEPAAAVQAFEQALRYAPDYEKARQNLATARALLPSPVVVNLPPRHGAQSALPLSAAEPEVHVTAEIVHPDQLPIANAATGWVLTSAKRPSVPSRVRLVQPSKAAHPDLPLGSSIALKPTPIPSRAVPNNHLMIYWVLAIFGVVVVMSVTFRRLFARN